MDDAERLQRVVATIRRVAEEIDTRWFQVRERKFAFGYQYARRTHTGRVVLWNGRHALHVYSKDEAAKRVDSKRNEKGRLCYFPDDKQVELNKDYDFYVNY